MLKAWKNPPPDPTKPKRLTGDVAHMKNLKANPGEGERKA